MNATQKEALRKHERLHGFYSEALDAFYKWEKEMYGNDSPLSDEDRLIWRRGFIYAKITKEG